MTLDDTCDHAAVQGFCNSRNACFEAGFLPPEDTAGCPNMAWLTLDHGNTNYYSLK